LLIVNYSFPSRFGVGSLRNSSLSKISPRDKNASQTVTSSHDQTRHLFHGSRDFSSLRIALQVQWCANFFVVSLCLSTCSLPLETFPNESEGSPIKQTSKKDHSINSKEWHQQQKCEKDEKMMKNFLRNLSKKVSAKSVVSAFRLTIAALNFILNSTR
jgi:hypothetical protein